MPSKKILFIEQNTDSTTGGSHYCLLEIVNQLNRERFEPICGFYEDNSLMEDFSRACRTEMFPLGNPIILFPRMKRGNPLIIPVKLLQKILNLFKCYIPFLLRNLIFILHNHIDLVHLNNSLDVGYEWRIISRLVGVKCLTHQRGKPVLSKWKRRMASSFDAVICIARFLKEDLRRQGVNVHEGFVVINDGIDPGYIKSRLTRSREDARTALGLSGDKPLIGIVGNFKPWKGQEIVVRAVDFLKDRYPDLHCLIIGDYSRTFTEDVDHYESVVSYTKEHGVEEMVSFLGYRNDVPDLVNCLDIFVHASTSPEPFGRVILEALVLETPVIATNFGGPLDIIEDGISGILVPPGDPEAMSKAIDRLLQDKDLMDRMAAAGRIRVDEKFLLEDNVRRTEELYDSLL